MAAEKGFTNLLDSLVPITRFNKGEASKIFDEVSQTGTKIVLKNNAPACVLLKPEYYQELMEELSDYSLAIAALKRLNHGGQAVDLEQVLKHLDITEEALGGYEDVELG